MALGVDGSSLTKALVPSAMLFWFPRYGVGGYFAQGHSPLDYSTYILGTGACSALAVSVGGIPKNPRASGGGRAAWGSLARPPSCSCNHFYLILLRVVHGRIYLLSDDALQLWHVYLRRDCILKESITQY